MRLSIVIPVFNGAKTIQKLVSETRDTLSAYDPEIILVNDGSADNSQEICESIANTVNGVISISLRKNFGEHNAVMCGLNYVAGDYAAIIDDDFQNPPSEIIKLLEEAQKGYDVVYSKYKSKKHNVFRNICSRFNDTMATILLEKPKGLYLSSFKIISKPLIDEIIGYHGPFPYIDGLIFRSTSNIYSVYVEHTKRAEGRSNYTFKKLVSLYLNMFVNFSIKPLRFFILMGFIIFLIGFIMAILFAIEKFQHPEIPAGWTSIAILIILFSGFQIIFLGVLG